MLNALTRTLLYPLRWNVTHLPRGTFLRSASIPILKYAARRRALISSLREVKPLDRRDISFVPAESTVMETVYWFGTQGYEGVLGELWPGLCANARAVLEIGGNVGFYTVLGGKAGTGVYTVVESQVPHILRRNLALNGLERIQVIESAHVDIRQLAEGCDLIKLDAKGEEHALLKAVESIIEHNAPTIVVKVQSDGEALAALLGEMAKRIGYTIYAIPSFRTERPVAVPPSSFTARTPAMFKSQDVILTRHKL